MAGNGTNSALYRRMRPIGLAVFALVAVAACQQDAPTGTRPLDVLSLAKGGGGGGGGAGGEAPTVTSTDPPSTIRDTTIDVSIIGTGFTIGAKAIWSLGGDTTQVHVKSTKVLSATQLIARIVVPAAAPLASYDVEVTLSNGKKGVGAEMFEVLIGDPGAAFWFPTADAGLGLRSDQLFVSGASSVYAENVCGVHSKIFATTAFSSSGDAIMHTNNSQFRDRRCAAYPRNLTVVYGPGDEDSGPAFINVREIANTTFQIPVNTTVLRSFAVNVGGRCPDGLVWIEQLQDGTSTNGGDRVNVTRVDLSTWLVESQPYPDNQAYCRTTGQLHHIAVSFLVIADRPMP